MYSVSGFRGSVRIIDFQLGDSPSFAYGKANDHGSFGPTFANYDVDDLHVAADGAFEFVLSGARRKDYRGDWVHEVDGRIAIERLDRPAATPLCACGGKACNSASLVSAGEHVGLGESSRGGGNAS